MSRRPSMTADRRLAAAMAWAAAFGVAVGGGCRPTGRSPRPVVAGSAGAAAEGMRTQLLSGVVSILSGLDRYEPGRGNEQVFDRLIQWQHAAAATADPRTEASQPGGHELVRRLPENLQTAAREVLARESFDADGDVMAIRDRCWLASIARTARGDATDDLEVAERLFRWTVRSLAPVSDPPMVPSEKVPGSRWFFPGEILLAGRGSGPQRAWIFLELLRQAGLDGVMLATPAAGDAPPRPWLPAAVIDGEAYLFEPTYGLPVPGPGGRGVATARQAVADPAILEGLSLPERRYPVQAADLAGGIRLLVPADPWELALRMAAIDGPLAAAHGIRVAFDPLAIAERAAAAVPRGPGTEVVRTGDTGEVELWTFPWETLARRPLASAALAMELGPLEIPVPGPAGETGFRGLFAGRVREFRGDIEGPTGAKAAYLAARPSRQVISAAVAALPQEQAAALTRTLVRIKEDATYWLGLLLLAQGEDEAAADYLGRMTLEAAPDSRWTAAARINLAAALVGLGRDTAAAELLRRDDSPQRFGSRLAAARLEAGEETP